MLITKSKYMYGQQCLKLLWLADRKQLPGSTLLGKHIFDQGHILEGYVKKLFPTGIDLKDIELDDNLSETEKLIEEKETIFEAWNKSRIFIYKS